MAEATQEEVTATGRFWREATQVDVHGLPTTYRRDGSGETLIYLHGAGLTGLWLPLYENLAKSFDVIVPDHPGFGATPMPEWLESFDDLVLHYDSFIRSLGLTGPVHLVGHSLGGWIAADLALHYPDRFASLTLLQPMGLRSPETPSADPFRWSPADAAEALLSGAAANYAEYFESDDPVESAVKEYEESITFARLTWNPRYDHRFDHRLAWVKPATTVIGFADDRYIPVAQAERWAELIPQARFELLDGVNGEPASHLSIIQQPDRLASMIAAATTRSRGV